jgi:hypothetical protein
MAEIQNELYARFEMTRSYDVSPMKLPHRPVARKLAALYIRIYVFKSSEGIPRCSIGSLIYEPT